MRIRGRTEIACGAGERRLHAVAMLVMLAASLLWLEQGPGAAAADEMGEDGGPAVAVTEASPAD